MDASIICTHMMLEATIAHRLATIENADQILVIDGGTVAQKGHFRYAVRQS